MVIEKHSSDLGHFLIYHLAPVAMAVALLYGVIFLMVRSATRHAGGRKRGAANVDGLNRRTRRQERATKRRKP